jgi:hypothetical protein
MLNLLLGDRLVQTDHEAAFMSLLSVQQLPAPVPMQSHEGLSRQIAAQQWP